MTNISFTRTLSKTIFVSSRKEEYNKWKNIAQSIILEAYKVCRISGTDDAGTFAECFEVSSDSGPSERMREDETADAVEEQK